MSSQRHLEPPGAKVPDSRPRVSGLGQPEGVVAALRRHARQRTDDLAVRFLVDGGEETRCLSFGELDAMARAFAAKLAERAGRGDRVMLLLDNNIEYVIAFYGCLYAGVLAVPAYPPESGNRDHAERLRAILADSDPCVLVSSRADAAICGDVCPEGGEVMVVEPGCAGSAAFTPVAAAPDDVAFLQYTSGSTSTPKGVMVTHGNLADNAAALKDAFVFVPDGEMVSWLPLYHDMGLIGALLAPLTFGMRVTLMGTQHFTGSPARWLRAISRYKATHGGAPNFAYQLCLERIGQSVIDRLDLGSWQTAWCGAEPIRPEVMRAFEERFEACGFRKGAFYPCYGLAEATLLVTGGVLGEGGKLGRFDPGGLAAGKALPAETGHAIVDCGFPRPGFDLRIVDPKRRRPLPEGEIGEVWLSGASIAAGYWRRAEATRETFGNALEERDGQGFLRTGDLGALHEGRLFLTGRLKDLIIVRGQNVYPQDIEQCLGEDLDFFRKGRISAFAVPGSDGEGIGVAMEVTRKNQKRFEPEEMFEGVADVVAARFGEPLSLALLLNPHDLPRTSSGKLRRTACLSQWRDGSLRPIAVYDRAAEALARPAYVAPRDRVEERLAAIWEDVFDLRPIGGDDDFFRLGGQSIAAARLMARVFDAFGVELPLASLLEDRTLATQARRVRSAPRGDARQAEITKAPPGARRPLSSGQERLWFLWCLDRESVAYAMCGGLRLRGAVEEDVLEASLVRLVRRHEVLRSRIVESDGVAYQAVSEASSFGWEVRDLAPEGGGDGGESAWRSAMEEFAAVPFDLERGPLLRCLLLRLSPEERVLVLALHHIVADGWSVGVLLDELSRIYGALRGGVEPDLPALPIQYGDYAVWEREWLDEAFLGEQLSYWRERLGGESPELVLPGERPGPAPLSRRVGQVRVVLGSDLVGRLHRLSQDRGGTLFMTLLAAFQVVLYRASGQSDIRVGVPFAGRRRRETQGLVGFFVNTLVMRGEIAGSARLSEVLDRVRAGVLEAQAHQDVPFGRVVDALEPVRELGRTPLFRVMFNMLEGYGAIEGFEGLEAELLPGRPREAQFDLTLNVEAGRDAVALSFDYAREVFEPAAIEGLASRYEEVLSFFAGDAERRVGELGLGGCLLQPVREVYAFESVTSRIQSQVGARGERLALRCGGAGLSYAGLEGWSSGVARRLLALGVGPEVRVGLCVERSLGLVAGLLGILKCGGAFVPLDASYPRGRLEDMASDAGLDVVVMDGSTAAMLGDVFAGCRIVRVDEVEAGESLTVPVERDRLAYVIYTSGSTGRPKGVAVSHGALSLHLDDFVRAFSYGPEDRVLQFSTFNFDGALEQLLPVLTVGGCAVLRGEELWDWDRLNRCLSEESITVADIPTAYWQQWQDRLPGALPHLRRVTVGGEALAGDALGRWRSSALGGIRLDNRYGPTEATVSALYRETRAADVGETIVPIGRAYPGRGAYVLDGDGNAVPVGGVGELCLSGGSLARGYLGRPGLTAERFVPDPHGPAGSRLYRTGDRCRQRGDGTVEFLGRFDDQVKLRGYRIELGEIEAALRSCRGVRGAAAHLWGAGSERRLVGYAVGEGLDGPALRGELEGRLPSALVPSVVTVLDRLPLTGAGKLDRRALPEPEAAVSARVAARDEREATLLAIWRAVLGRADLGVTDNFFEAGGDSILSLQVISRARQASLKVTPRQVFEQPTVETLARVAETGFGEDAEAAPYGDVPFTPIQRRFFEDYPEGLSHWNQSMLLHVSGTLDPAALERVLAEMIARHDALRLRFTRRDGRWCQVSEAIGPGRILDVEDLTCAVDWRARLERRGDELQASLDLESGPLLRACYFRLGEAEGRLLLVVHHLAVDGVSWRILFEDLAQGYAQSLRDGDVRLAPASTPWRTWARALSAYGADDAIGEEIAWWRTALRDAEALPGLPADRCMVMDIHEGRVELTAEETAALVAAAPRAYRLRVDEVLLAALVEAVCQWSGQRGLLLDLEGHGREDVIEGIDLSRTVGWFTTRFPLWVPRMEDIGAQLREVKERLRSVPARGLHWGLLEDTDAARGTLKGLGRGGVGFNYLGRFDNSLATSDRFALAWDAAGSPVSESSRLSHAIDVNALIADGVLEIRLAVDPGVMSALALEALAARLRTHLGELISHCRFASPVYTPSDFPLAGLSAAELASLDLPPAEIEDIYPATAVQLGLLFHSTMREEEGVYINQLRFSVGPEADLQVLRSCWQAAVDRHPVLRSCFAWRSDGEALQVVRRDVSLPYGEEDWSRLTMDAYEARLSAWRGADLAAGFDVSRAPLMRMRAFSRPDGRRDVLVTNHHALLDGWSAANLFSEVVRSYTVTCSGGAESLPPIPPYRDYVAWLGDREDGESWWRGRLSAFENPAGLLEAVGSRGGEERQADNALEVTSEARLDLDPALGSRLGDVARSAQVTLSTIVQAAWALVLSRYSGSSEAVFGVTVSGRAVPVRGIEDMVGLFINSLPVWTRLPGHRAVDAWLRDLQRESVELRAYEHTPLHRIQGWAGLRANDGEGLFDSLVVFENYPLDSALSENPIGLSVAQIESREHTHYPVTLTVMPGELAAVQLAWDRRRLDDSTAKRLLGHLEEALNFLGSGPAARLGDFGLSGGRPCPVRRTHEFRSVPSRIAAQAAARPASCALICGDERLAYGELEDWSNGIAGRLSELGVGPEILVGLCVRRSVGLVAGLLGILKAGGAFVPLDASHPRERLVEIATDAALDVVVMDSATAGDLGGIFAGARVLRLDEVGAGAHRTVPSEADQLAYVIYTSGSTGRPKGVAISHGALSRHLDDFDSVFGFGPEDRVLQFSTFNFDSAMEQLLPPLIAGGTAVMRGEELWDWDRLNRCLLEESVTVADFPTTYWQQWQESLPDALPAMRLVTVGGEALAGDALGRWRSSGLCGVRLDNVYGPTEATVSALYRETRAADVEETIVPIGRVYPGRGACVLDGDGNVAPVGGVGELCLSGGSLARGYLGRPGLTAERFVPDPYGPAGSRLYRTGDRCRQRGDGTVEFLGRFDDQVKLRGYRIELGEIEAALRSCRGVRGAAAHLWGTGSERRLVGYAVGESLDGQALRGELEARLPSALVPSAVMVLDALPLTGSGKLDRRALPEPEAQRRSYVAPSTGTEESICAVLEEVLDERPIGAGDNFFDLGGHSLLALRAVSRLSEALNRNVRLNDLFENPTPADLARALDGQAQADAGTLAVMAEFLEELA